MIKNKVTTGNAFQLAHAYGSWQKQPREFVITIVLENENQERKSFNKGTNDKKFIESLWDIAEDNKQFKNALFNHVYEELKGPIIEWLSSN